MYAYMYASWRKHTSRSSLGFLKIFARMGINTIVESMIDPQSGRYKNRGRLFALVGYYSATKDIKVFSVSQFGFSFG